MDKAKDETIDRLSAIPGVDDASSGTAEDADRAADRSRSLEERIDAAQARAPDGKYSEAAGGGAAGSGGTGGPAADPSDKGAYGGGGT